jgi:glucoamylase
MADGTAPRPATPARQSWTSGAKDAVITSLSALVWATVGQGIINEVFWPAVDQPQVRDFGFLVLGPPGWREVKAVNQYTLSMPEDPAVPITRVTHAGDFYTLAC